MPEFRGLKVSQDPTACRDFPDIRKVATLGDRIIVERPGLIGRGGNSGFQALNLAVQFRPRRIVLVGFDLRLDYGAHWHGRHARGLNNPSDQWLIRWRLILDRQAGTLAALGIDVVNASPISALTAYRKVDLLEAIAC